MELDIYVFCIYIGLVVFVTSVSTVLDYSSSNKDYVNGTCMCVLMFFSISAFAAYTPAEAIIPINATAIFILIVCCGIICWCEYKIYKEKHAECSTNFIFILIYKYIQILSGLLMYTASLV